MSSRSVWHIALRIVLVAALLLLCALSAVFVNNLIGYLPLLTLLVVLAALAAQVLVLARSIRVGVAAPDVECMRGSSLPFEMRLENASLLPCFRLEAELFVSDLFGARDATVSRAFVAGPRSALTIATSMRFDHVGCYEAGISSFRVYDVFGLFSKTVEVNESSEIEVVPRCVAFDEVPISDDALSESKSMTAPVANEGMDYAGVREYVIGDPIKSIHWKLSARSREYLTRLYETYSTPGICVFVDLCAPAYQHATLTELYDVLVEAAFSLGGYARGNGFEFEMRFVDAQGQPRCFDASACEDAARVMREMPCIGAAESQTLLLEQFEGQAKNRFGQGNLVICTCSVTEETVNALIAAKQARKNPILLAAVPRAERRAEREDYLRPLRALDEMGVAYRVVSSVDELERGVWA